MWSGGAESSCAQVENKPRVSRQLFESAFVVGCFASCYSFFFVTKKYPQKAASNEFQGAIALTGCMTLL